MFETARANGVLRIFNHLLRISTLIIIGCPTMNNGSYVCTKCVVKRLEIIFFCCFTSYITYLCALTFYVSLFLQYSFYICAEKYIHFSFLIVIGWLCWVVEQRTLHFISHIFVMNVRNVILRFYN